MNEIANSDTQFEEGLSKDFKIMLQKFPIVKSNTKIEQSIKSENSVIKMQDLTKLKLITLGVDGFDEKDILVLQQFLCGLNNLEELEFVFASDFLRQSIAAIGQSASSLKHLKQMTFVIGQFGEQSSDEFVNLSNTIAKFDQIQSFDLKINLQMGDQGILQISKGLKNLQNLKQLSVTIGWSVRAGSVAVAQIGQNIKSLKELQSLSLFIEQSNKTEDYGLIQFSKKICQLKQLKTLHIRIDDLSNIYSEGFCSFGEQLKNLMLLEELNLSFYIPKIGYMEILEEICSSLSGLSNLKVLCLSFIVNSIFSTINDSLDVLQIAQEHINGLMFLYYLRVKSCYINQNQKQKSNYQTYRKNLRLVVFKDF